MSNFFRETKNPVTDEWELVEWIDNYDRPHHYGVKFPSGSCFPEESIEEIKEKDLILI